MSVVRQCCVCRRVRRGDEWVVDSSHDALAIATTHVYCSECAAGARRELVALAEEMGQELGEGSLADIMDQRPGQGAEPEDRCREKP
jgi:hypothetical protein